MYLNYVKVLSCFMQLKLRWLALGKDPGRGGGGYCHIWAIWVCPAAKGMVFKQGAKNELLI